MAWKLSLFGYQENEVNEYLQALSQSQGAAVAGLREKVRLAMETNVRQDIALTDLRQDAQERKNRLKAVESRLILVYYRTLLTQGPEAAGAGAGPTAPDLTPEEYWRRLEKREQTAAAVDKQLDALLRQVSRWGKEKMDKQKNFTTSLLGVSPRDLEEYLHIRDKSHQEAIGDLAEKLSQLEKAIALQGEEIKALEDILERPEMQKPFIDLAERFLSRFESSLEDIARKAVLQGGDTLTEREKEYLRREGELRLQIARCRRKVNMLLRSLNQQGKAQLSEQAPERLPFLPEKLTGGIRAAAEEPADSGDSLRFRYLLGKVAGNDLRDHQGQLLVKKGQAIGRKEAAAVYRQGLLEQLVRDMV